MKTLLQSLFVFGMYLLFLFVEGFLGFMDFGLVASQASADTSRTLVLKEVENMTPRAMYELEGFDTIEIRFILSNEISADLLRTSCPGSLDLREVHIDQGIEYFVVYSPSEYCDEVRFFIHDVVLLSVRWDRWGDTLSHLLDLPTQQIVRQIRTLNEQIASSKNDSERIYKQKIVGVFNDILKSRDDPSYIVPVPGSRIPTHTSYIPNAKRNYRKDYTDGIHHGWDFYGAFGAPIVALDDGVVIYIRKEFVWDDFSEIEHNIHHLPDEERRDIEHQNLDVLRGKQVWIKTMTGDVAFYSHFNEISEDLQEGDVVSRGQKIGTIGVTGVPQRGYNKYHLHIPLMINPLVENKVGKYTRLDIMKWDWYGAHKDNAWIFEKTARALCLQIGTSGLLGLGMLASLFSVSAYGLDGDIEVADRAPGELQQKKERIASVLDAKFLQEEIYTRVDGEPVRIDVSNELEAIRNLYTDVRFVTDWNLSEYDQVLGGSTFSVAFSQSGLRNLRFSLFEAGDGDSNPVLLYAKDMDVYVYQQSIPMISFLGSEHPLYRQALDVGILLYPLFVGDRSAQVPETLLSQYVSYFQNIRGSKSDYILILGDGDHVVDAIHQLFHAPSQDSIQDIALGSFVVYTDDDLDKTRDLAKIFLKGKTHLDRVAFSSLRSLVDVSEETGEESLMLPLYYDSVTDFFVSSEKDYRELDIDTDPFPVYQFVSQFANSLTNQGMTREDLYVLFIIPYLLSGVVIFRHLLGFGGIGILLPIFLTFLAISETWYFSLSLYIFFFFLNVIVSRFFRGYAMLYVPRIAFNISWNVVVFIFVWTLADRFGVQIFSSGNALSYVLFFFLLERTISLIWSKDLGEYLPAFFNTLLYVLVMYFLFSLEVVSQFILGYPEIVLVLIPLNFFFGRYRGLRLTEYFRFRDLLGKEFEE